MGTLYVNYYFNHLTYDDNYFSGSFSAPDSDISCEFRYNRKTEQTEIWNNNKPEEMILPLPVWWLEKKLRDHGKLNKHEHKISY